MKGLCATCRHYASNLARQCGRYAGDGAPGEAHQPQQEWKLPDEAPPHRREPPPDPGGVQRHRGRGGAPVRLRRPQQRGRLGSPVAQILTAPPRASPRDVRSIYAPRVSLPLEFKKDVTE